MQPDTAVYVAPARRPLTFLHKPSDAAPGTDWLMKVPVTGWTACGAPMLAAELWVPVERQHGDRVCPACDGLTEDGYVQEVLL
jgi:hypothetical protein